MFEFVCLAGMAFGSFWGFSNFQAPVNTEKGLLGGAAVGTGAGALLGRGNPEVFTPIPAEKKEGANDAAFVVAFWDNHIHSTEDLVNKGAKVCGLVGRVYLISADGQARNADGKISVDLYNLERKQPIKIAQWTFDAESLKKLKHPIGDGYTLFLPWESVGGQVRKVRLNLSYEVTNGTVLRASPASVTLSNPQGKETKTDGSARFPSPFYTHDAPRYFPPSETYPLPKELRSLEDAAKQVHDDVSSPKTTPVPAQPWVADAIQECVAPKDSRLPIMPPIKAGERPTCDDPPGQAEILRALPRVQPGLPYIYQVYRDDVEFTVEKLADRIETPRFFPLIGTAQLHHCHWKCTVYFTETIDAAYPWPFRVQRKRAEVVYIDKDSFHLCAPTDLEGAEASEPKPYCPAGGATDRTRSKPVPAIPAARSERSSKMTINDVLRMSQKNIAEDIILRQMELTNAVFNLTVDDIIELHDAGVNATIIRAMQERYEENATQGTVYSSIAIDRMTEKLIDHENLRKLHDEWRRFWMNDQPPHLTPNRTPASPSSK